MMDIPNNTWIVILVIGVPILDILRRKSCVALVHQINTGLRKYVSFLTSPRKPSIAWKPVGSYLLRRETGGDGESMMIPILKLLGGIRREKA